MGGSSACGGHRNVIIVVTVTSCAVLALIVGLAVGLPVSSVTSNDPDYQHAIDILSASPLIDGHNDLAWRYLRNEDNDVSSVNLNENMTGVWPIVHTDIPKLLAGKVGAQFWALYTVCDRQYVDAVRQCLEQADVILQIIDRYPQTFELALTAQDIKDSFARGKIGSLIGMEGGHCLDSSMATLRMYYKLGVRYMTVTHSCNTPWADNFHEDEGDAIGEHDGLTDFGKDIIREMNRLGMIVDLSHTSNKTQLDAIEVSEAPVIFSHSSAFALCNHHRNVQDEVLLKVKEDNGVVMVNFYNVFINCAPTHNGNSMATLSQVADHIEHIAAIAGHDCVGIGGDYDGVDEVPIGLEDVSKYPDLFVELIHRGWSDDNLTKLAGTNLLRVMEAVEQVAKDQQTRNPDAQLFKADQRSNTTCFTTYWQPD